MGKGNATTKKSRSGTVWTDADYDRAGYGRVSVRLSKFAIVRLGRLAAERGLSRTAFLEELIDGAHRANGVFDE